MLVKEALDFERGINPRDAMKIGNPEIRKINSSLASIQSIVSAGFSPNDLDFPRLVENIENLKEMILIVIKKYMKKNFDWDFVL
jgi:hypothetical protein